jgi:hypothetical protein
MSTWTSWPERAAWTGQTERTERTGRPAHDNKDMTVGHPEQDSWARQKDRGQSENDSICRTGQIGKLLDKSAETGSWTRQVGQDRWDRPAGADSWDRTMVQG